MRTCSTLLALSLLAATAACVEAPPDDTVDRAALADPSITAVDDLSSRMAYTLDAWEQRASLADDDTVGDAPPPANATARQVECGIMDNGTERCCVGNYCCFWSSGGGGAICI
ncbi:MAG: hypothetical protein JNK64_36260 [Myxococcales bacterium]|nr:hypothetical protein [Myxococcales bacterium]